MDMAQPEPGGPVTPSPPTTDSDATALSTAPSFVKTIRSFSMQFDQFEIPATFVKENGHRFQKKVTLRGPSGQTKLMDLRILTRGQNRVYFAGAGWRDFALECGFKVGYRLQFSLVSKSTFSVRVLENPTASFAPANKHNLSPTPPRNIPTSSFNDVVQPRSSTRPSKNVRNDVVYMTGTWYYKHQVEALLENFQCPHFVVCMGKSHLRDKGRSSALRVPAGFMDKYGMYFADVHFLRGPSGGIVEVRFARWSKGARFTAGWTAFYRENGIRVGDVLLFSLLAPASWLVQVVEHGPGSEELGAGELCSRSDSDAGATQAQNRYSETDEE